MYLVIALILITIIVTAGVSNKLNIPLVVIALFAGMLFGSDGLKLFPFDNAPQAQKIADFALVFVLFIGGFVTRKDRLKIVFAPAMIMATFGVILTAVVTAAFLNLILKFELQTSILIGCIIASTDAAAVFSILRTRSLDKNLSALVEIESATNDPMAIVLTTIAVSLAATSAASSANLAIEQPLNIVLLLAWKIVGGAGLGLLIGWGAYRLSKCVVELDKGYFYIYIVAIILFSYGLAELTKSSGILSAFFAGFVLGNSNIPFKSNSSTFLEALSTMGNVVIFVLLGLLVSPSEFRGVFVDGILLFIVLTFIARPIVVAVFMSFFKYSLKKNIFLSWSGLRGAVPMVLATYPAAAGIENANYIFNIVFFAVLLSMLIQGSTITTLADKFKLADKAKPRPKQLMELVALHNAESELLEITIDEDEYGGSAVVSSLKLPEETTITMINRNDKIIAPTANTEILTGDILYVLTKTVNVEAVTKTITERFIPKVAEAQVASK
ncbi:MAG: potassium/proton antiporter [Chitinivibrionia bacterium]|nr:potassium/proton antiporter [Chitinivibrionia bacterium]